MNSKSGESGVNFMEQQHKCGTVLAISRDARKERFVCARINETTWRSSFSDKKLQDTCTPSLAAKQSLTEKQFTPFVFFFLARIKAASAGSAPSDDVDAVLHNAGLHPSPPSPERPFLVSNITSPVPLHNTDASEPWRKLND